MAQNAADGSGTGESSGKTRREDRTNEPCGPRIAPKPTSQNAKCAEKSPRLSEQLPNLFDTLSVTIFLSSLSK
jgi:hypothetical protein